MNFKSLNMTSQHFNSHWKVLELFVQVNVESRHLTTDPCSVASLLSSLAIIYLFFTTRESRVTAVMQEDKHKCEEASDLCCHLSLRPSLRLQR